MRRSRPRGRWRRRQRQWLEKAPGLLIDHGGHGQVVVVVALELHVADRESALRQQIAGRAHVLGRNDAVLLEGTVDNWEERYAVENAAWSAPGVKSVDDRLAIGSSKLL